MTTGMVATTASFNRDAFGSTTSRAEVDLGGLILIGICLAENMSTLTHLHSGRWLVRIEPRGATHADVAVLLPLCDTLLQQAQTVADHYDLPHGCASSICFYLGHDSPFPVTTSINAASWPIALSSYLPPSSRRPSKVESWALPVSLPLPSSTMLTGLPICANLCFDFGTEEGGLDADADAESEAAHSVSVRAVELHERPNAPTPNANYQHFTAAGAAAAAAHGPQKLSFLKMQHTPNPNLMHMRRPSPSWERRSSFQEMPYANLDDSFDSPSPRAAIFSGPLSPATRRMRTFAFHAAELRRRQASSSVAASPRCGSSISAGGGGGGGGGGVVNVPVSAAATVAAAGGGGVTSQVTTSTLADFIRERSRRGVAATTAAAEAAAASPKTTMSHSRMHTRSNSQLSAFHAFKSPSNSSSGGVGGGDDELDDTEDGHSSSFFSHSRASSASIGTFRRSRSSLFSSTQGTTVWNEDDTIFEDARPPTTSSAATQEGGSGKTGDVRRHSRLESNKGLPVIQNGTIVPFWSISSSNSSTTTTSSSANVGVKGLGSEAAAALAHAVERRRAQAIRVVDVATAKLISPSTAATIVGRSRAYTSVEPPRDKRVAFFPGASPTPEETSQQQTFANAGLGLGQLGATGTALASTAAVPAAATQPAAQSMAVPTLKTVKVPIINRTPANGTLARRRALTMHQPSRHSSHHAISGPGAAPIPASGLARQLPPLTCARRPSALTPTPTTSIPISAASPAVAKAVTPPGKTGDSPSKTTSSSSAAKVVAADSIESSARTPLAPTSKAAAAIRTDISSTSLPSAVPQN
ncbi:hypothetical protein OC835_005342 [Tilletia horrida]|nr:hypothetical protein OC835_005342 [Tilletia horrida]